MWTHGILFCYVYKYKMIISTYRSWKKNIPEAAKTMPNYCKGGAVIGLLFPGLDPFPFKRCIGGTLLCLRHDNEIRGATGVEPPCSQGDYKKVSPM